MNGFSMGQAQDDYGYGPRTGLEPQGKVVVDSYSRDINNGFEREAPLNNPVCSLLLRYR
jgi:hypothetical protein